MIQRGQYRVGDRLPAIMEMAKRFGVGHPTVLDVLRELFTEEQRLILNIFGSRERDHEGHLAILEALERRDAKLGVKRMRAHLKGVEDAILRWNPAHHPVA